MDLKRCINFHFYDGDKYDSCPHCANMEKEVDPTEETDINFEPEKERKSIEYEEKLEESMPDIQEEKKEINEGVSEKKKVKQTEEEDKDDEKTSGFYEDEFVVGWLVAVEGAHKGTSFVLGEGKNFIGRSSSMDVSLLLDKGVSRDKHVEVIYDAKNNEFTIFMGESKELVYVNGDLLLTPLKLNAYDKISVGNTELLFVPFCSEQFIWK